jgi:glyoxylase-like metal-dependent hydrolase (beta-lactamase superfamily II)
MIILEVLVVGYIGTNCYLYGDAETKEIGIIDPGGNAPEIIARIQEMGYKPKYIIITHGHPDHTEAAPAIAKLFQIPIIYHKKERIIGLKTDTKVQEGDTIMIGSLRLEIYHSPGHTDGGMILVDYSNKIIFVGDTLFQGSIGRTDLGGDFPTLMSSIREKIMQNPKITDDFEILPGHMDSTTVGMEKKANPFRQDFL